MPLFVRKFIVDAVETAIPAIFLLTWAGDAESTAHAAVVAIGAAVASAARRATPGFLEWFRNLLGVSG